MRMRRVQKAPYEPVKQPQANPKRNVSTPESRARQGGLAPESGQNLINQKGMVITMKIAVTYENGQIFQHFGHTAQFKIYDTGDGKILSEELVSANGAGHSALAALLRSLHVDALICGGIGGGAQAALAQAGVTLYGGVSGSCDAAVQALLAGNLGYDPDAKCSHHDHEHGEHGHTCSEHGCGGNRCGEHHCR